MLKPTNNVNLNPNSPNLFFFKPRQVLLAEHRTNSTTMSKKNQTKTKSLTQEQKTCLLHSVVKYLENNALSKTLKRVLSEAQIEGEEWKSSCVDLEELYCKYLDTCNQDETTVNTINNQELQTEGNTKDNMSGGAESDEVVKKKKKKRSESEKGAVADKSDTVEKEVDDSKKKSEELSEVNVLIESAKVKGKKKDKKSSDYSNESEQVQQSLANTAVDENNMLTDKVKDKKKKKSRSNNVDQEDEELMKVVVEEQSKDLSTAACGVDNEKKSSKKRKRLVSDENEIQSGSKEAGEEIKPKKAKGSEKTKKKDKSMVVGENEESEKQNSQVAKIDSTKISKELHDEHEDGDVENTKKVQLDHSNGDLEKSGYKSSNQKSTKQRNGSAEPKTANAFQRVKIDEVEFADEKLQDNSYWAKSGAEIGYGAKAQEVLGQVRGRDFRHEKTKKKRGSYRGGMIDQQSHSVKFNYSDED